MRNPRLSGRYAKSLMDIAVEQNAVESIYEDMLGLQKLFAENRELVSVMHSPVIPADKKQNIVKAIIGGKANPITEKFITLLTSKAREYFLPEIATTFIAQYKELNKINTVHLTTAHELDENVKANLIASITAKLEGKKLDLITKVDEKLIGGFVLESNNNLFDASVARDLKDIQKQFLENIYVPSLR
jgi:F-type H+-transporting ATPase subunit delta